MAGPALEVLWVFLRLGLTSFGGPVAHLGFFQRELVERRRWVDAATYADLVALCQLLPGPASSQVAMALGLERAGLKGALAAWVGFTLPSALLMALFAAGAVSLGPERLRGLLVVAVPVVTLAVLGMARALCPDRPRALIATGAALAAAGLGSAVAQVGVLLAGGAVGWALYRDEPRSPSAAAPAPVSRRTGALALAMFVGLLGLLPLLPGDAARLVEAFYRAGALVFGGGHVVLPLLEREVVGPGWMTPGAFLAGYGAAQAVPGPLFSFAAYLGFVRSASPSGWVGAGLALVAIFLPALLLVVGALPFWARLRASQGARAALRGANAAVVGLLLAALVDPVARAGLRSWTDVGLAVAGVVALARGAPPWLVVVVTAVAAAAV